MLTHPLPVLKASNKLMKEFVYDPYLYPKILKKYIITSIEDVIWVGFVERVICEVDV